MDDNKWSLDKELKYLCSNPQLRKNTHVITIMHVHAHISNKYVYSHIHYSHFS